MGQLETNKKQKKIEEIQNLFKQAKIEELPELTKRFSQDTRSSVKKLVQSFQKKYEQYEQEQQRLEKMSTYEKKYEAFSFICGIDEAGRGPLAGPVVAGAVILKKNCQILYLNDSKQVSEKKREELYNEIKQKAISVGVGIVDHKKIDEINILQATYEAMRQAIQNLSVKPDKLLNDAVIIPKIQIPQESIIKGDTKSISIAAASIIAKVTRDRLMVEYDKVYPGYGFAKNKGYGSKEHIEALKKLGPCSIHRKSFIKNFVIEQE